jgi:hypothetical protein
LIDDGRAMSTWTEIDEPMLRWLDSQPAEFIGLRVEDLVLRPDANPFKPIRSLDTRQVDDALGRLHGHGLIEGRRGETVAYSYWWNLRVTGQGRQVLGDWPALDLTAGASGLRHLLAALARDGELSENDRAALGSATGFLADLGDGVVNTTISEVAVGLGEGLLGP